MSDNVKKLDQKKLDGSLDFLKMPGLWMLAAQPGSGKSYLIKYLMLTLARQKKFDYCMVVTDSPEDYEWIENDRYVHTIFDEKKLENLLRQQKQFIKEGRPKRAVLILDDVIGMINWNSKLWKIMISNYRHYLLTIVLAPQYIKDVPPRIRKCASNAFLFYQDDHLSRQALFDAYGLCFGKLDPFVEFLNRNTQDYNVIIANTKERFKEKKYKQFKAPLNYSYSNSKLKF